MIRRRRRPPLNSVGCARCILLALAFTPFRVDALPCRHHAAAGPVVGAVDVRLCPRCYAAAAGLAHGGRFAAPCWRLALALATTLPTVATYHYFKPLPPRLTGSARGRARTWPRTSRPARTVVAVTEANPNFLVHRIRGVLRRPTIGPWREFFPSQSIGRRCRRPMPGGVPPAINGRTCNAPAPAARLLAHAWRIGSCGRKDGIGATPGFAPRAETWHLVMESRGFAPAQAASGFPSSHADFLAHLSRPRGRLARHLSASSSSNKSAARAPTRSSPRRWKPAGRLRATAPGPASRRTA